MISSASLCKVGDTLLLDAFPGDRNYLSSSTFVSLMAFQARERPFQGRHHLREP